MRTILSDTWRTCEAMRLHMQQTQRTLQSAHARIARQEGRGERFVSLLLDAELACGWSPGGSLYQALVGPGHQR